MVDAGQDDISRFLNLQPTPTVQNGVSFQEFNFKLPAFYQPSSSDQAEPYSENHSPTIQNMVQPAALQTSTHLPQTSSMKNTQKKTSNDKGYLLLHFFRQMVKGKYKLFLAYICRRQIIFKSKKYNLNSFIRFCNRIINNQKYSYIKVDQFKKIIQKDSINAKICLIAFIKYFDGFDDQQLTRTHKHQYYADIATILRRYIISVNKKTLIDLNVTLDNDQSQSY